MRNRFPQSKRFRRGATGLISTILVSFALCCKPGVDNPVDRASSGTSVVVLVDFSKSFAVSRIQNGKMVYGLRPEDRRALNAVGGAVAELSSRSWTPPLKTLWTQIQTASITDKPLCAPLETVQKLVKPAGSIGTREEIEQVLTKCTNDVIEASKDERRLSAYTDISGAIATAADASSPDAAERVLIILSDFNEELVPGSQQARFTLKGERVVLIHRPGTDEPNNIGGYLARINDWKNKLLQCGASAVVAMPVFAVSESRLRGALRPKDFQLGTDLTVVADFKNDLSQTLGSKPGQDGLLVQIGQTLSDISRDWPPPVTTLWMAIGESGFESKTLPPVEFGPSLIKKEHALNTVEEFARATEELARTLPNQSKNTAASDISGSLALASAVEPSAQLHVVIVISDFVDNGPQPPAAFNLNGSRVVMICASSNLDRPDPNSFFQRRQAWEKRFLDSGASSVNQIPLMSFTPSDLRSALSQAKKVTK